MAEDKVTNPTQPKETAPTFDAQFFVMPDAYRHGKEVAMVEPKNEEKKQVVQTPPPPPSKTVVPPKQVIPGVKPPKSNTTKALMIAGVIVVIALGIGGYLVARSVQKQPEVVPEVVPVIPKTPREEPVIPKEPEVPVVVQIIPGRDRDSDGLSDTEEQLVYSTNPNLPDSDADGFLDGNEVFHRYNPNGTAPGTLIGSGLAKEYTIENIKLVYPSLWTIGQRVNDQDPAFPEGLLIVSTTGEQIRVSISNTDLDPIELLSVWRSSFTDGTITSISKAGYELFVSQDNLQAFLIVDGHAVRFEYVVGTKTTVEYQQTFQMMINSIEEIEPAV